MAGLMPQIWVCVCHVMVFRCIFGEQVQMSSKFEQISVVWSLIALYGLKN